MRGAAPLFFTNPRIPLSMNTYSAGIASVLLGGTLVLFLAACDSDTGTLAETRLGETKTLGQGTAQSWVRLDANGNPEAVGVTLTESALNGLPPHTGPAHNETVLRLPAVSGFPFHHIGLDWNPAGHEPTPIYGAPHFDVHFYLISPAQRDAIDPTDPEYPAKAARQPQPRFIPAGYVSTNDPVPRMGVHWIDPTSPEFNGQPFTATHIYGFFDGRMVFFEPMVTKAFLEQVRNQENLPKAFVKTLPQPQFFAQTGYYPTEYAVRYDDARREFTITLEKLTLRTQPPS